MKKLILCIAAVAMMLPSCKKINESLDSLGGRLDKLEQETIPSIDEQIAAINTSLSSADAMDKELKNYIDSLIATATNLQEQINSTNTKIDDAKAELKNDISTAKTDVLAQLEALETELKNELAQITATIVALQAKDAELDSKITELKNYVDTELCQTTNWISATFATLEQYNALVTEVATIKEQIKAINDSITILETNLITKINEDIATAVSTLSADIQQKVSEITTAYTSAVTTAKEDITAAYTAAIQSAISTIETSLKAWVGEQLANYYTIAEVDAKITALQNSITEGDSALQEELNKLEKQLETTASELTEAYKKAIEEAINANNGVINAKIANDIAAVNQRIDSEVATINAKIAALEARLDNVEVKIAELLARIQSVSYIPQYSDGKAVMPVIAGIYNGVVELDFQLSPKSVVSDIIANWQDILSVKAVYTKTRAVTYVDMPILSCVADEQNGIITVIASGRNLKEEFFLGNQAVNAALFISDGNNDKVSDYIEIVPINNLRGNIFVVNTLDTGSYNPAYYFYTFKAAGEGFSFDLLVNDYQALPTQILAGSYTYAPDKSYAGNKNYFFVDSFKLDGVTYKPAATSTMVIEGDGTNVVITINLTMQSGDQFTVIYNGVVGGSANEGGDDQPSTGGQSYEGWQFSAVLDMGTPKITVTDGSHTVEFTLNELSGGTFYILDNDYLNITNVVVNGVETTDAYGTVEMGHNNSYHVTLNATINGVKYTGTSSNAVV